MFIATMSKNQNRVLLQVSGSLFAAKIDHLLRHPSTRLGKMFLGKTGVDSLSIEELTFDRPSMAFGAILSFYQTGELHIPLHMCPKAFKKELEYWQIDPSNLDNCCLHKYMACLSECDTISAFQAYINDQPMRAQSQGSKTPRSRIRERIWSIVANKDKSKLTKVFLLLSVIMVAISLTVLILGTLPKFQTPISPCDMVKLAKEMGIEDDEVFRVLESFDCRTDPVDKLKSMIYKKGGVRRKRSNPPPDPLNDYPGDDISSEMYPNTPDSTTTDMNKNSSHGFKDGNETNEGQTTQGDNSKQEDENEDSQNALIEDWLEEYYYKSSGEFQLNEQNVTYLVEVLHRIQQLYVKKPLHVFYILDDITIAFFTIELILRLISCPDYKKYFSSVINIIDIIILVAAYVTYIAYTTTVKAEYDEKGIIRILQYLQMFRVLRILRMAQNIAAVRVLGYSMRSSLKDMMVLFIYLFIGCLIFASFLYFAEDSSKIESMADACWWSVITMTTVGYGDLVPTTGLGRFVGSLCAISGVILLSMVIPVFVNTFMSVYQFAKLNEQMNKPCTNTKNYVSKNKKDKIGPPYQVTPIG